MRRVIYWKVCHCNIVNIFIFSLFASIMPVIRFAVDKILYDNIPSQPSQMLLTFRYIFLYCTSAGQMFLNRMFSVLWQVFDNPEELRAKVEILAQLIKESQYLVVHSGAGISTSAGIPDFRWGTNNWSSFLPSPFIQTHRAFLTCFHFINMMGKATLTFLKFLYGVV